MMVKDIKQVSGQQGLPRIYCTGIVQILLPVAKQQEFLCRNLDSKDYYAAICRARIVFPLSGQYCTDSSAAIQIERTLLKQSEKRNLSSQLPRVLTMVDAAFWITRIVLPIKNNLNICIKTEPVTIGAGVMLYVWFPCQLIVTKNRTYTVASTQAVTGIVFKTEVEINFLSQRRICIAR